MHATALLTLAFGLALLGCAKNGSAPAGERASGAASASSRSSEALQPMVESESPVLALEFHAKSVGVLYEYDRLLARLREGAGGEVRLRFHESDVQAYVVGPEPSGTVAMHLTPEASARWRGAFAVLSETNPFVLSFGGTALYSGVLYPAMGAAAINSPVVHASDFRDHVVLTFGAVQGMAYMRDPPPDAQRIDRPELRQLFRKRGALREQPQPPKPVGEGR